jgi:hypothetical protein
VHHAHLFFISGESYRLKSQLKKKREEEMTERDRDSEENKSL